MHQSTRRWSVGIAMLVLAVVSVGLTGTSAGVDDPQPVEPAAATCDFPGPKIGLTPTEAGARYSVTPLWDATYRGAGVRVAQLQFGASIDQSALEFYEQCMHVDPLVPFQQHVIGPGAVPPPSNESMADAEMVVGLAPEVERLDVFVSPSGDLVKTIGDLLTAALDPANTGGERVDIISISYETCEPSIDPSDPDFVHAEALLQQAAEEGVWILKGEGDSGSSGCAPKGDCTKDPHTHFLAVDWPSTSPWVISTGGTMLPENAPVVGTPGVVWGEPAPVCGGTGGGVSILFPRPDWQRDYPGPVVDPTGKRMVPDVASLAGSPGFELYTPGNPPEPEFKWRPIEGDSMTGPLWAGAMAVVKSALVGQGITVPVMLNPELYRLASDPATYATVFRDIQDGSNDLYNLGCCSAGPGYDQTTGLGEVAFSALVDALAFETLRVVPTLTG